MNQSQISAQFETLRSRVASGTLNYLEYVQVAHTMRGLSQQARPLDEALANQISGIAESVLADEEQRQANHAVVYDRRTFQRLGLASPELRAYCAEADDTSDTGVYCYYDERSDLWRPSGSIYTATTAATLRPDRR